MIDKYYSLYNAKVGSKEQWSKSVRYGNICLQDFKCPRSIHQEVIKKMATKVSEEIYMSIHMVDSGVGLIVGEDGMDHNEEATKGGFLIV